MTDLPRIYLDNAATSWPKPPGVVEAIANYVRDNGAPAGRSGYGQAQDAQRIVSDCRRRLAKLVGAEHPRQIALAFNGTDALNMALHGLLRDGGHVVTTDAEHNSVLRPLHFLSRHAGVRVTRVGCDGQGRVDPGEMESALRDDTRLVAVTHVSNVTGAVQPVEQIGAAVGRHGRALLLIDAAQSLGHLPIDAVALGADLIASSGHKGLLGPLGTGLLYVGPRAAESLLPFRQGGTGTNSESEEQPEALPERLESGNLNMVGIVGLAAAIQDLDAATIAQRHERERKLTTLLLEQLADCEAYRLHGPPADGPRVGVVSLTSESSDPHDLSMLLDASFGVQTRAGLHCAPLMHRGLGTEQSGGTLRISVGPYTTEDEVLAAARALLELAQ